jgi:STE24 endopeptidase
MSVRGALSILGVLAVLSAGLVGLVSRAPANVRRAEVAAGAREPDRGARFSAEQVRRAAAYNRPSYLAVALLALLRGGLLVALALGPWGRLVDALQGVKGGWAVRAVLAAWILVALAGVVTLPVTFVHGFVIEHAWGLSTQGVGGWATDRLRSLLVGGCTTAVAAVAFFGVVRWQPRTWWLWGWGAFTLLTALLVFIWPLVVAPLFNRFTPLDDPELREAVTDLARGAGVEVSAVLVADASRRTRTENAYVAGLGETRRLVLYDTLLEGQGRRETLWVVGHELGHEAERHVLKGVVLSAAGLLVGFGALAWLAARPGVWAWAGSGGVADLKALPVLLLFATVAGLLVTPVENAVSRGFERRADAIAMELTRDPDTAVGVLRGLALRNLSDLEPPSLAVAFLYSHPPVPERIRNALAWGHSTR